MTQQATTPFVNPIAGVTGMGTTIVQVYDVTAQTASGTITLTLPQAITKGKMRIKSTAVNASTTTAIGAVTATDGTNPVQISAALLPTTAAGARFDLLLDFACDIQATSISFATTLAGATQAATINTELYGNP